MPRQGVLAKSKNLKEAFGTDDVDEVCKIILARGDLQVSDKERDTQHERCGPAPRCTAMYAGSDAALRVLAVCFVTWPPSCARSVLTRRITARTLCVIDRYLRFLMIASQSCVARRACVPGRGGVAGVDHRACAARSPLRHQGFSQCQTAGMVRFQRM